ncbi:MAG: ATP-binding protein [Bacteroidetes bacterium]|nr:ATP-binding protein [Bacteroidota bacterium]
MNKKSNQQFETTLREIQEAGIQADNAHIKRDMCAQFTDPNEWIREYVVNSYDAQATMCQVYIKGSDGEITVIVSDDGHGMDRQGIIDFCTLYRSRKQGAPGKTVGQFGIGKLSVAAIPGQKKFKVKTSNGMECWIAEAGNLLSEEPIQIYSISDVPPHGTLFEITFETKETADEVMLKLSKILRKYTSYLPFTTELHFPADPETGIHGVVEKIRQDWSADSEDYGRSYSIQLHGYQFDVVLGVGIAANEIYQNKVLVSDRYNLLSHDISNKMKLPHLRIRINSSGFELPFGRHCLRNEYILAPISRKIREDIIPHYFNFLLDIFTSQPGKYARLENELEDIAAALVFQIPDHNKQWCNIPLFRIYPDKRVSLVRLEKLVTAAGKIYLEESENTGVDYSFFDAPILLQNQPKGGIAFLQEYFKKELINLSLNDVVIEAPATSGLKLSKEEIDFQQNLGLADDILRLNKGKSSFEQYDRMGESDGFGLFGGQGKISDYGTPEQKDAAKAFNNLTWKVNYLVSRDGKTPCLTHRFIINQNTVILNLHHPDVKELVNLTATAPKLAGHWAVAMCLTEDNRILSFLSAESREDLLLIDAMIKANTSSDSASILKVKEFKKMRKSIRDLLKDSGFDFGLN